jgi:hypothetical protein
MPGLEEQPPFNRSNVSIPGENTVPITQVCKFNETLSYQIRLRETFQEELKKVAVYSVPEYGIKSMCIQTNHTFSVLAPSFFNSS